MCSALARVHLARGEFEAAAEVLHHAERVSEHMHNPYWHALNSVATHVRFWIARGELERAARWAERVQHEQRHVAPLARELEDMALVRIVFAQHKANEALTRLVPLLEAATKQERWGHVIELLLLQTVAYLGCQEEQAALSALSQAVYLAEPEGYVRRFVGEGVPISGREQEVLHLLAGGASNQEIAERLVIMLDTVKRHVSNILSKLGVSNRTQAITRARSLGML